MLDSGPCSHCVPDSHPYSHCKSYDIVQRPRPWVSRDCGRKRPQPKAYRHRRGSCSRIGDHHRRRTWRCHQSDVGNPSKINCRRRRTEYSYAPSFGMASLRAVSCTTIHSHHPGPNTIIQSAVPARAGCSPPSARNRIWIPHCTALIGSVSSSR